MSTNYYQSNPKRLRSPLLDGIQNSNKQTQNSNKGKKIYFNLKEEGKSQDSIDETLDSTLFNNKPEKLLICNINDPDPINHNHIDSLITSLKVACILISAMGGILSLLELINVVRIIYSGNFNFGNSLTVFVVSFIGTILANVICLGFINLVRTIKYLYLNSENQNKKIDKLLMQITQPH